MCCLHGAFVTVSVCVAAVVCQGACGKEMGRTGDRAGMCSAGFCGGCEAVLLDMCHKGHGINSWRVAAAWGTVVVCSAQSDQRV